MVDRNNITIRVFWDKRTDRITYFNLALFYQHHDGYGCELFGYRAYFKNVINAHGCFQFQI